MCGFIEGLTPLRADPFCRVYTIYGAEGGWRLFDGHLTATDIRPAGRHFLHLFSRTPIPLARLIYAFYMQGRDI